MWPTSSVHDQRLFIKAQSAMAALPFVLLAGWLNPPAIRSSPVLSSRDGILRRTSKISKKKKKKKDRLRSMDDGTVS